MVIDLFNAIAPRYDALNRIMTFGMDVGWRQRMALDLPRGSGLTVLDLATGTGDVALVMARQERVARVTGIDLAEGMLAQARQKVSAAGLGGKVELMTADAMALPFADDSFDVVTVSFGLRNLSDLMKGLMEAYRVLKPGGRMVIMEFSSPRPGPLKALHAFYLKWVIPHVGGFLTGRRDAYRHLVTTVRAFPYGERFCRILRQVGFLVTVRREQFLGVATIYVGEKAR